MKQWVLILFSCVVFGNCFKTAIKVNKKYGLEELRLNYGGDLPFAICEIILAFPATDLTIAYDFHTNFGLIRMVIDNLMRNNITVQLFNISTPEVQEQYFDYLNNRVMHYLDSYTVFFCTSKMYEHLLLEIYDRNHIRRNLFYLFYWGNQTIERYFIRNIHDAMKVFAITNPRQDTFRLYYNQNFAHKSHHLVLVNWWQQGIGLFHHPTIKGATEIYKDFKRKVFHIPVIHKPPWHFVNYLNDNTIEVLGGRDDRILQVISQKLNFKYEYFDPPDRIQGSSLSANGSFEGVLGLIWKRQAELFIGDVALTLERSTAVEFSFLTLADSGAFVTHAPSRLNEALALLRPFQWQVWPAILVTLIVAGPFLYFLIALPNAWQPRFRVRSHARLFFDCAWYTTTIILRQTGGKELSASHKARFFIILLSISATYVIGDMYSANLTSLLARPGREKAINNLAQLERAMILKGYNLYVERHSSTYGLLENGTGIYGRLWGMMTKRQPLHLIESVEDGVKLVRDSNNVAVIAGRETLFFDIQRFGPNNFHLSEKLNTAYSAIAFQLGCPYIDNVNRILMSIFEAGILTKMTENEYEKLEKSHKTQISTDTDKDVVPGSKKETRKTAKANVDNEKLKPISFKMLQGAFYLLLIGHVSSGLVLLLEYVTHKHHKKYRRRNKKFAFIKRFRNVVVAWIYRLGLNLKRLFNRIMHDAFVATLEYIE